jgi:preprotein translocase subunit YajC
MNYNTGKRIISAVCIALVLCFSFAGCTMTGGAGAGDAAGAGQSMQMILSIVVLFAVFYFFMIRPEKKRKKQAEELRSSLSTGEKIVTIGGMMGTIVNVTDESITFETGEDRVRIEVAKWAVSKKTK